MQPSHNERVKGAFRRYVDISTGVREKRTRYVPLDDEIEFRVRGDISRADSENGTSRDLLGSTKRCDDDPIKATSQGPRRRKLRRGNDDSTTDLGAMEARERRKSSNERRQIRSRSTERIRPGYSASATRTSSKKDAVQIPADDDSDESTGKLKRLRSVVALPKCEDGITNKDISRHNGKGHNKDVRRKISFTKRHTADDDSDVSDYLRSPSKSHGARSRGVEKSARRHGRRLENEQSSSERNDRESLRHISRGKYDDEMSSHRRTSEKGQAARSYRIGTSTTHRGNQSPSHESTDSEDEDRQRRGYRQRNESRDGRVKNKCLSNNTTEMSRNRSRHRGDSGSSSSSEAEHSNQDHDGYRHRRDVYDKDRKATSPRRRSSERGHRTRLHGSDRTNNEKQTRFSQSSEKKHPSVDRGRRRQRSETSSSERDHRHKSERVSRRRSKDNSRDNNKRSSSDRRRSSRHDCRSSRQKLKHDKIKPDKFDGSSCIEAFLAKFNSCALYNGWDAEDKSAHLRASLVGGAGNLMWQNSEATYDELVEKLRSRYGSREQQEKFRVQLRHRKRKENESLQELAEDIERLVTLAFPKVDANTRDTLGSEAFINSLDNPALIFKVREKEPERLNEAVTLATKLEVLHNTCKMEKETQKMRHARGTQADNNEGTTNFQHAGNGSTHPKQNRSNSHNRRNMRTSTQDQSSQSDKDRRIQELEGQVQQLMKATATASENQRQMCWETPMAQPNNHVTTTLQSPASQTLVSNMTPWHGTVPGESPYVATPEPRSYQPSPQQHFYQPVNNQMYAASAGRPSNRLVRCYNCNEVGHLRRNCPYEAQHSQNNSTQQSTTSSARGTTADENGEARVYVKMRVGRTTQLCLLDTGCDITLIPARVAGRRKIHDTAQQCIAANGTQIPILGWTLIKAWIGRNPVNINGLVTEHVADVMLGIDWLRENDVIWNFRRNEISIEGQTYQLESRTSKNRWCRRVILADNIIVPARSQMNVETKAVFNGLQANQQQESDVWGTEPHEIKNGILVARTLLPNRANDLPVRIVNTTQEPMKLHKNTVISTLKQLQPVSEQPQQEGAPNDETRDIIASLIENVDRSVPEDVKGQLREMLQRYSTVFSRDEWDLGWTDRVTHKIDVGENKPIRQQLRRYPPSHMEAIDQHLSDMLRQNVIEPANSPWASNIVLAKKKDGTLRCCIDFRQLNDITRKDAYPLPRTDACLDAMSESKFFSTFDLRSGFHQVAMAPEDADKTAFITRRGMFRFRTMPFGLCNAVATFQRLMDLTLSGLNLEICLAYLDDIIVFSSTPEQHLERLEKVFRRLQEANLKLKPSKCSLMQTEVSFLGHVVNGSGISTDPEKIKLIGQWPVPNNLRELRGFLGLTGYYRRFVCDYAKIAGSLNNLNKKNARFEWTEECQSAFDELKNALQSPPILALPNDKDTFVLDTDASEYSIGAVLSQVHHGQEKVIAYAGRALNRNEVNYCVTRKELLAVVYFTKYFRQYLLGRKFVIRTDHAALSWLKKTPQPIGQNARWLELLGEFDFIIKHRQGRSHGNADALSRHPCLNKPSCTACHPDTTVHAAMVVASGNGTSEDIQQQTNDVETDGPADRTRSPETEIISATGLSFSAHNGDTQKHSVPAGEYNREESETSEPQVVTQKDGPADELCWSNEEIAEAQRNDSDIGFIISLMSARSTKPEWKDVERKPSDTKSLWNEWERLELRSGVLCRKWTSLDGTPDKLQVVLPREYRSSFIKLVHTGMTGGHMGRSKTEEQVRLRAYWPNWRTQVASELKKCVECAQYHRGKAPRQTPLQPFGAGEPFEVIAMDITGPHPRSSRGNEYIVTITDIFSKWCEAYPVRVHTAQVVAKILIDNFISRFGAPKRLLTDQGSEFESHLFQELCRRMEIEKIRTTPYKPSTNGCVERFHKTLNAMLGKIVQNNQRDWDDRLQSVMAAYRAAKHSSTGFSPNQLIFGRENRAPIDLVLGEVSEDKQHYDSYDEYVLQFQNRLRESYALAREHLEAAAERRKNEYDIKVKSAKFSVGQWVWYYYPRRYVKRSPKWSKNYDGPFLIVKVISPCDYVIQKNKRSRAQVVHGDKLKLCYSETPTSWLSTAAVNEETATEPEDQRTENVGEQRDQRSTVPKPIGGQGRYSNADFELYEYEDEETTKVTRPERRKRLPTRFQDYRM